MIDGHGDDTYKYAGKIISNFSSNILKQPSDDIYHIVRESVELIGSYPEPDAQTLRELLAHRLSISPECIGVTNGATEAIYLIAGVLNKKHSHVVVPTFSEYQDACGINQHKISFITSIEQLPPGSQVCWLCNPNNPNGTVYNKEKLFEHFEQQPNTIFIIDQSYAAFTLIPTPTAKEICQYPNVVGIFSMTKEHAIPGLRLGYFVAHKQMAERIKQQQMPWSVNQIALEVGKFLVSTPQKNKGLIIQTLKETSWLMKEIASLPICKYVHPSQTHYFLCQLNQPLSTSLKEYLVRHHGILIRDASNFKGLDRHFIRIATQTHPENISLLNAINQWNTMI